MRKENSSRRQPWRLQVLTLAACCTVTLASCGGNNFDRDIGNDTSREDMSLQQQWSELMQRPNIDEAADRLKLMLDEITKTLSSTIGLPPWEVYEDEGVSAGCNDFKKVDAWDAVTQSVGDRVTPTPIEQEQWPQASKVIKDIAARYGFTKLGIEMNRADYRQVAISATDGANLMVTSGTDPATTLVGVRTGCHLLPKAKQRGVPTQSTTPTS